MNQPNLTQMLAVSRGDRPADLVLRNARIVNVFSGQIEPDDIALAGGFIVGIGRDYAAVRTIDLAGAFVAPGLIDAHVHIESSLCVPAQLASAVVPRGITTVVADPHEIANVAGMDGVRFMHESSRGLPLDVVLMAPSCVPATNLSTAGAVLNADDLARLRREGIVHGLAEMMNYPGLIGADASVLAKLRAFDSRPIDGHAPGVSGKALCAYVAAGVGSDHESVALAEARGKLSRGLRILIREATNARNLEALLPLITPAHCRRICFCSDDRQPGDLLDVGSIDEMVRRVIARGTDPVIAFQVATLNAAEWFGLHDRGAIAPGRRADLVIFDEIRAPAAREVYVGGRLVAAAGRLRADCELPRGAIPAAVAGRCCVAPELVDLRIAARGKRIRVIGSLPDQLVTEHLVLDARIVDGQAVADVSRDILKMAVIERHGRGGGTGLGFIHGIGLKRGAIAGTVAHDHHNLVVIGCDDDSMRVAIDTIAVMGGGLAATAGQSVLAQLALPVGGLMSDRPISEVRNAYERLLAAAREMGSSLHDPFMAMSFMALEVIPKLKLTDRGLVDVESFRIVDLFL